MQKIIEDLYHGNIDPAAKAVIPQSKLDRATKLVVKKEEKLLQTLQQEDVELFMAYSNACDAVSLLMEEEMFAEGFRLGARMMLAMLTDDNREVRPLA